MGPIVIKKQRNTLNYAEIIVNIHYKQSSTIINKEIELTSGDTAFMNHFHMPTATPMRALYRHF